MAINNRRRLLLLSMFKTLIGSVVQFFSKKFTAQPIKKIIGNTQAITDETYKSGLVTPYDTIKTNQIIPDNLINLTTSSSVVPTTNTVGSYISKWLTVENRVGHKVYARIIPSDNRLRLVWYKNNSSGYDFATGQLLDGSSSIPSILEGIYTITQDMVWPDGYAQLYYFVFSSMPTGSHTITLQLTDLTEIYGEGNEPTNLITLKAQHPELSRVNAYGYRLIGAGEHIDGNYITASDGTIIPLSAPLYKVGDVADTVRTNVGENRKFEVVNLGEADWQFEQVPTGDNYHSRITQTFAKKSSLVLCSKYQSTSRSFYERNNMFISSTGNINCSADGFNSDPSAFKNSLNGVIAIVEREAPSQTLFDAPFKPQSLTSVTDGFKQLALSEVRDEYVKHLENVQKVEYRGKNLFPFNKSFGGTNTNRYYWQYSLATNELQIFINSLVKANIKSGDTLTADCRSTVNYGYIEFVINFENGLYSTIRPTLSSRSQMQGNPAEIISVYIRHRTGDEGYQVYSEIFDIMLTEGSTATPYEPYFEPTILEDLDLKSAGTVKDYIEVTRSNVIRHDLCNEESLGDLNYSKQAVSVQGKYRFISNDLTDIQLNLSSGTVPNIISNKFTSVDPNHLYSGSEGITTSETTSTLMLYSDDYNDLTVEQVKTLLDGAKIVYARSSEIVTDITSTTIGQKLLNLHTTKEATNIITVDNNGQVVIKYKP